MSSGKWLAQAKKHRMKKVVFGAFMLSAGILGIAVLMTGVMTIGDTVDGVHSFVYNLSLYGIMPVYMIFLVVAVAGLLFGIWGMAQKKE